MRRFLVELTTVMITVLGATGCGGGEPAVTNAPPGPETSAVETPPVTETTPEAPAEPTQAPEEDQWQTAGTLSSDSPSLKGYKGLLISEPFTAIGEARLVLEMPEAEALDGVLIAVIPAELATDPSSILAALGDERSIATTLSVTLGPESIGALDDSYVLVNSVPTTKEWTVLLQTR